MRIEFGSASDFLNLFPLGVFVSLMPGFSYFIVRKVLQKFLQFFHEIGLVLSLAAFLVSALLPSFAQSAQNGGDKPFSESLIKVGFLLIFITFIWIVQLSRNPRLTLSKVWFVISKLHSPPTSFVLNMCR
jgi:hypothetical protein